MKTIGIFYGTTTGTTEGVASEIAKALGVADADVHDVSKTAPSEVDKYDVLIFGASTWGDGDLQDDMQDFLNGVQAMDLKGKIAALFGCGDESMSETFCNGVGKMYEMLKPTGVKFIGEFNADGYTFGSSESEIDGKFVGLDIDNVNHDDMTAERVQKWTDEIKAAIA